MKRSVYFFGIFLLECERLCVHGDIENTHEEGKEKDGNHQEHDAI